MNKNRSLKNKCIILFLFFTGVAARLYQFGIVPNGLNQDEAFAGYEAWNLLTAHHDTMGYSFPVYLFTNGGGMNALETYLLIPLMAIFGPQDWVIRIPQVVVAILSMPATYGIARRIYGQKAAIWTLMVVSWCPWHIMMSRWGLESNLAPGMLLFGLYFFLRGEEKKQFYLLSAFFYGTSLYSYAVVWLYVPVILLISVLYLIHIKKLCWSDRILWKCVGVLVIMGAPLVFVLGVNYGYIGEIKTRFFSVPKLDFLRTSQTSGYTVIENLQNLWKILIEQSDGLIWNSPEKYGLYYPYGIVFVLMGVVGTIRRLFQKIKWKQYAPELFVILQFACGLILGTTSHVNVNRINIIWFPLLLMEGCGLDIFCRMSGKFLARIYEKCSKRVVSIAVASVFLISFIGFEHYYFTDYKKPIEIAFDGGMKEALIEAEKSGKTIHINRMGMYPKVLYYSRMPVNEYMTTRVFSDYHPMPQSAGNLYFDLNAAVPDKNGVFILQEDFDCSKFIQAGFHFKHYGSCIYAFYPE